MKAEEFFNIISRDLVDMLSEIAFQEYGELLNGSRYVLWSSQYGGNSVNLAYRGVLFQFGIGDGGLVLLSSRGLKNADTGYITAVVNKFVNDLGGYPRSISKVEGLLTHEMLWVRTWDSGIEPGAVEIYLGC